MSNNYEFRHAAEADAPDFALIGFDLLDISLNLIGKDVPDRTRLINSLAEAAKLCFEPVRHGKWKDIRVGIGTCSECGERYGSVDVMNYCPNCGARMDIV